MQNAFIGSASCPERVSESHMFSEKFSFLFFSNISQWYSCSDLHPGTESPRQPLAISSAFSQSHSTFGHTLISAAFLILPSNVPINDLPFIFLWIIGFHGHQPLKHTKHLKWIYIPSVRNSEIKATLFFPRVSEKCKFRASLYQ